MQAALQFPDISPEIFAISIGTFQFALRWYALAYIVGLLIGWRLAVWAVQRARLWANDSPPMTPKQVEDLLTWVILGVILGGRLGFVLFYKPLHYLANPWEIPMLWQGGMAFHGGLIGVALATYLYCRHQKIPMLSAADMLALATPPALFLGRIANFINAELWGRATDLPWAVIFPGALAQDCPGVVGPCARHPSQLYEATLEGLLLALVLLFLVHRGALRRPGIVAGVFFAGYGLGRALVELVRQPDFQFVTPDNPVGLAIHYAGYGLTMGQILSLPMILLGVVLILRARAT